MPVIKQKTVGDDTLQLKRVKTQKPGKQWEYYVTEQGGGPIDDPVYTREDAMQQFRETVSAYERANEADRNERGGFMGGGFMGGGGGGFGGSDGSDDGPTPVGMGFMGSDDGDENDDDDGFRFF